MPGVRTCLGLGLGREQVEEASLGDSLPAEDSNGVVDKEKAGPGSCF